VVLKPGAEKPTAFDAVFEDEGIAIVKVVSAGVVYQRRQRLLSVS
jgi:hypothetical protein